MSEWARYELSDFLMFSPTAYYRMIELYHGWLWPWHLAFFPLFAVVLLKWHQASLRLLLWLFALSWVLVGGGFFYYQFGPIFWAAYYIAAVFIIQAVLLVVAGFFQRSFDAKFHPAYMPSAFGLAGVALLAHPLITLAPERSLLSSDLIFVTPDPTVIMTFSLLLCFRSPWWLFPIPVLWAVFSGLMLFAMESPWYWVMPATAMLAIAARVLRQEPGQIPS